tara:strand:- start:1894 stop:2025 length:132 start_codon:yes stop_codon:yes gene_type:complete
MPKDRVKDVNVMAAIIFEGKVVRVGSRQIADDAIITACKRRCD